MTNRIYVVCPWIPSNGRHAGYEVLQSYQSSAAKFGVEMRLDILGHMSTFALLMKISRRMINRNAYAFSFTLNLAFTIWLFLKYRNKNIFLYIEPEFLILAQYLSKLMSVGIIVHDDPIAYLKRNRKSEVIISKNAKRFRDVCHNAICGIFISEFMKKAYEVCYEQHFQAIHISYTASQICSSMKQSTIYNRIGIFGTPLTNELIDKSLDPITQLSKTLKDDDEICIFNCNISYSEKNIKTFEWLEQEQYLKVVNSCNFSLVDDKSYDNDFANYSFPTKLVFSIFNAIPVLYTGPKDSAIAQFILAEKIGVLASPTDLNDLQSKFEHLKKNEKYFQGNSRACYFKHFRQELQLEKLKQVLRSFNV